MRGWLSDTSPGLFAPAGVVDPTVAGYGVVDPAAMLLAVSLLLAAGLREHAAAKTLERAIVAAQSSKPRRVVARRDDQNIHRRSDRATAGKPYRCRTRGRGVTMTKMLGSDAILRSLEAEGVEVAFGIPGGAILPTYDAIARGTTVRHVLARHEQGAGHMAEGYARASGRLGVAIATSGPGATNLVTAIADAWMDSTPLVCVTGPGARRADRQRRVPGDRHHRDHAADRQALLARAGRQGAAAGDEGRVPRRPTGRCGPVLVDVTKDVQEAEIDFRYPDELDLAGWRPPTKVHPRQVREAAAAILAAKRPIFYVGGGVLNGDATRELLELVELGRLPAVVTLMGKSALPDSASAQLRLARHARLEVRELGAEQVRPDHRGRARASTTASPARSRRSRRARR